MIYAILCLIILMLSCLCLNLTNALKKYHKESKYKLTQDVTVINYNYDNLKPITLQTEVIIDERFFMRYHPSDPRMIEIILEETKYKMFEKLIDQLRNDFNNHFDKSEIFDIKELPWYSFNKIHKDQKAYRVKLTLLPKHKN